MPYACIDDKAIINAKLRKLSSDAFRVWVLGLVYCQSELTDGFIPADALSLFGLRDSAVARAVTELTKPQVRGKAALWSASPDGFTVYHYIEWGNKSRADVEAIRHKDRARKRPGFQSDSVRNPPGIHNGSQVEFQLDSGGIPATNPIQSNTHVQHPSDADAADASSAPKKKAEKEPTSDVGILQSRYIELLAKNLKVEKPNIEWEKLGTIFKRLVKAHTMPVVQAALERFMADHSEFVVEARWIVGAFQSRFNRYLTDVEPDVHVKPTKGRTGITSDWTEYE